MSRRLLTIAIVLLWAQPAAMPAAETVATATPPAGNIQQPQASPTLLSRVRGLFDVDLAQFDPPGTFRFRVNPHFGDLFRKEYLRVSTSMEWAATDSYSLRLEVDTFGPHGFRDAPSHYGIGQLHPSTKYRLHERLLKGYDSSIGLNTDLPVGHPPTDLTSGSNHYMPYIVFQHQAKSRPRLTTFFGSSLDFVTPSSVPGNGDDPLQRDSVILNGGGIYNMGQLKWTVQSSYQTTALISEGSPSHTFALSPSLLWFVPKRYTFNSKTQWMVGFGLRSSWGPGGVTVGTSLRVQADLTFRQAVDRLRNTFDFRH